VTHIEMRAWEGQREKSDGSAGSCWASPQKNFFEVHLLDRCQSPAAVAETDGAGERRRLPRPLLSLWPRR
jgi:hypothetical protein